MGKYADLLDEQDSADHEVWAAANNPLTPEDLDRFYQAGQEESEQSRARAMNEAPLPTGKPPTEGMQFIDQPESSGSLPEPTPGKYADLLEEEPKTGKYADLLEGSEEEQSDTPATDSALAKFSKAEAKFEQEHDPDWLKNFDTATQELVKGIPGMAKATGEAAYQGAKFAVGGPQEKAQVAIEVMKQAVPQGEQMAKDLQSPVGSHEWWRGALQAGMMATPALEFLKGTPSVTPGIEKPPIMPSPTVSLGSGTAASDVTRALAERGFTMVPEPATQLQPAPELDPTLEALGQKRFGRITAEGEISQRPPEVPLPSETARIGGETDASKVTSTESVPERPVRARVGEEAPLRQPGETAGAQEQPVSAGETVAPPVQAQPDAPESGISTERLQDVYGKDAVIINQGKSAKAWKAIGDADKRNPYEVLTQARRRGIVGREDTPLLRSEHQRLIERARNAYGTPAYPQLAQYAADFANAVKTVAHGPAHDIFMQLQEADVPKYDSPADFDNILRERMQREANMKEKETFKKVTDEVKNGDAEAKTTAKDAKEKLKKIPGKTIKFEDAVNHVKQQIKELTEPCAT